MYRITVPVRAGPTFYSHQKRKNSKLQLTTGILIEGRDICCENHYFLYVRALITNDFMGYTLVPYIGYSFLWFFPSLPLSFSHYCVFLS